MGGVPLLVLRLEEFLFNFESNSVRPLEERVLSVDELDAAVLELVVHHALDIPVHSHLQLDHLPEQPLSPLLSHYRDVAVRLRVLQAQVVTVLHKYLPDVIVHHSRRPACENAAWAVSLATQLVVVGVLLGELESLLGIVLDVSHDVLHGLDGELGLGHVGPVQAVDAVGAEYPVLQLDHFLISSLLPDEEAEALYWL